MTMTTIKMPSGTKRHKSVRTVLKDYFQIPSLKYYNSLKRNGEAMTIADNSSLNLEAMESHVSIAGLWGFIDDNNLLHVWTDSDKPLLLKEADAFDMIINNLSAIGESYLVLNNPKKYSLLVQCISRKSYEFTKIKRRRTDRVLRKKK